MDTYPSFEYVRAAHPTLATVSAEGSGGLERPMMEVLE